MSVMSSMASETVTGDTHTAVVAAPLKDSFARPAVERVAEMMSVAVPEFDRHGFVDDALGTVDPELGAFEPAGLTDRARLVTRALQRHLPSEPGAVLRAIRSGLGPPIADADELGGMDGFVYLPLVYLVDDVGHADVELALDVQEELTQRFTCEFSIRSFIERAPEVTMPRLEAWTGHASEHVRRLVSEGTRPRLPWAARLRGFQADPTPVIALLDRLVTDDSEYVRRSVANNLNDIAKDHPETAVATAARWWSDERNTRRLVRHGLRTLIKAGDPGALTVIGFEPDAPLDIELVDLAPAAPTIGDRLEISVRVSNPTATPLGALVDLRIGFVKANGSISPKVFKGAEATLEPGADHEIRQRVSLAQHSTRTHHPGTHTLEAVLNGRIVPLGSFDLAAE